MEVYSLSFIYLFLPVMLLATWAVPARFRPEILLAASLLAYYFLAGSNLWLLLTILLFDWLIAWILEHCDRLPRFRKVLLFCAVAKVFLIFLIYALRFQRFGEVMPVGLTVVCVTSLGYVIDCYNGYALWERNPVNLFLLNLFFPKLYAGPIVSYGKELPHLRCLNVTLETLGKGGAIFVCGLAKTVIIAKSLKGIYEPLREIPIYRTTVLTVWVMVLMLAYMVYFGASGLCDIARGIGAMVGFQLPENFLHPYRAVSVNDFFSKFNLTVNRFVRRYLYINLGGANKDFLSNAANILLATILMSMWFGFRWNMVVWGGYFTCFLLLERYWIHKHEDKIPTLFRWLYCSFVVMISFVFWVGETPSESISFLQVMFGMSRVELFDKELLYLLNSNWLVLVIAPLWALGLPNAISTLAKRYLPKIWEVGAALGTGALLVIVNAYLL